MRPDNAEPYKTKKQGRPIGFGIDRKAHVGGSMFSMVELLGRLQFSPNEITIFHGRTAEVIREMQWFQNGSPPGLGSGETSGAKNQPPRPFAGLDHAILTELHQYLEDFLKSAVSP